MKKSAVNKQMFSVFQTADVKNYIVVGSLLNTPTLDENSM